MITIKAMIHLNEKEPRHAFRLYTDNGEAIGRGSSVIDADELLKDVGLFDNKRLVTINIEITDPIKFAKCIRRQM